MSVRSRAIRVCLAVAAVGTLHLVAELGPVGAAHGRTPDHASVSTSGPVTLPDRTPPTVAAAGSVPTTDSPPALRATFAYAGTDDPYQRLIATWDPTRSGAPWIVTVHGGSWVGGKPADVRPAVDLFRSSGFQVFNLRYRLVGSVDAISPVTVADQRADVQRALAWIREHAASFGIDPDRGALYGSSAGGNLALAAGLAGDGTNGIRAVVSVAGVVQPSRLWDDVRGHNRGERVTLAMRRLAVNARDAAGCAYPAASPAARARAASPAARARAASPAARARAASLAARACAARWRSFDPVDEASPHDPAVLMFQGLADRTVPYRMATAFRAQLNRAHVGGSLVLVAGLDHSQQVALDGGTRQATMLAFLRARTAGGPAR